MRSVLEDVRTHGSEPTKRMLGAWSWTNNKLVASLLVALLATGGAWIAAAMRELRESIPDATQIRLNTQYRERGELLGQDYLVFKASTLERLKGLETLALETRATTQETNAMVREIERSMRRLK